MSIKTLRASGTRIQAEVVVGEDAYGSAVTVAVSLNRKSPEVEEALEPLLTLVRKTAKDAVGEAQITAAVRLLVRDKAKAVTDKERERIARNAKVDVEKQTGVLQRRLEDAETRDATARRAFASEKAALNKEIADLHKLLYAKEAEG